MATYAELQRMQQMQHYMRHPANQRRHGGMGHNRPPVQMATDPNLSVDPSIAYYDDVFTYVVSFGNLVAGASSTQTFNVQMDSKFEWMKSGIYAVVHGATQPLASDILYNMTVSVTDTGSGLTLMNNPVPVSLIAGTGQLPFINATSRIFTPAATVQVTMANIDAAQQYDLVYFAFIGRKIFKGNRPEA